MPVGYYDPDEGMEYGKKKPRSLLAKTDLQKELLRICGYKSGYFKDTDQRNAFKKIEEKANGETEEQYLYREWILHNFEIAKINNRKIITRNVANVMRMIGNEERRIDWTIANRKRLLEKRKHLSINSDDFFRKD